MRESLSSNHFSHDQQVSDVLTWLSIHHIDVHNKLTSEFPETNVIVWSMSQWDTDRMAADPDLSSWVADAIEDTGLVWWEDCEPWTGSDHTEGCDDDDCEGCDIGY